MHTCIPSQVGTCLVVSSVSYHLGSLCSNVVTRAAMPLPTHRQLLGRRDDWATEYTRHSKTVLHEALRQKKFIYITEIIQEVQNICWHLQFMFLIHMILTCRHFSLYGTSGHFYLWILHHSWGMHKVLSYHEQIFCVCWDCLFWRMSCYNLHICGTFLDHELP